MSDMKISLPDMATITITGQIVDKLIRLGDGDAALLYLYIIKMNGQISASQAAIDLNKNKGWIASALANLSKIGLASVGDTANADSETPRVPQPQSPQPQSPLRSQQAQPQQQPQQPPPLEEPRNYTIAEIKAELTAGSEFSVVVNETQRVLARILSPDELLRLYGIYDYLRLPVDVILLLITHCISESRKSSGGRMPSMRYIEKAAFTWEREGLFSAYLVEEYLKKLDDKRDIRSRIKAEIQIRNRELSATEDRYVEGWINMGFESSAIAIAYDRTVIKTGNLTWPYMDSILKNWHKKGIHDVSEILEAEGKRNVSVISTDPGEKHGKPSQDEMDRMTRILNRIKDAE